MRGLVNQVFRFSFFSALVLGFLIGTPASYEAGAEGPMGSRFNGEILKYEIGFWVFSRLGAGEATFRDIGNGKYSAYHQAQTLGAAAFFSRYRRDIYRSTMGTIHDGKRLIPFQFEEDVIIGGKTRRRTTIYDYAARKVYVETAKDGRSGKEEVDIPFGVLYDDPMTAFYNFRAGVYGKVEPGKNFLIHTVPRDGSRKAIRLLVATEEEAEKWRARETDKNQKDFFVTVQLDKELVGSLQGLVYTWFSKEMVPISGVAKDVFFWGDITGKLTYRGVLASSQVFRVALRPGGEA